MDAPDAAPVPEAAHAHAHAHAHVTSAFARASALVAWLLLALALVSSIALNPANPFTVALAVVALALAAAAVLTIGRVGPSTNAWPTWLGAPWWAYVGLAVCAACGPLQQPANPAPGALRVAMAASGLLSLLLLGLHAGGDARTRRLTVAALLLSRFALLLALPLFVPRPTIDVWQLQQLSVGHLLHGSNPYTTPIPDIYEGRFAYGHQSLYPYPPLNLILSIPSWALCGDYRFGLVAAMGGALWLLRAAGRLRGASPLAIDLVSFAFLLHPELERLLIHGWTEPYLILALAAFLYLTARAPGTTAATAALLCMPLIKQYTAVPVLLGLVLVRPRPRALLGALALVALSATPLLVWNFSATVRLGLLFFVQQIQFRGDSISLPAALHRIGVARTWEPGVPTTLGVQLIVAAVAGWRLRRLGAGGWLLAAAVVLLAGFLVAPQAFLNYYCFTGVLLLGAALWSTPPSSGAAPRLRTTRGLLLVGVVATLVTATSLTIQVIDFAVACAHDGRKGRARIAASGAILDGGATSAGPDDMILTCATRHCLGPLCHEDLACVCAPRSAPIASVEAQLAERSAAPASCQLDQAHPSSSDESGACRRARCDQHATPR